MANKTTKGRTASVTAGMGPGMSAAAAEAYKQLRTNLMYAFPDEPAAHRVFGLTSSLWDEGKALAAINLAYTLAETEKKVLLIEADMRAPSVAEKLGFAAVPGLSNLLEGLNNIGSAIQSYEVTVGDREISFDAIVSGPVPSDPSEMLSSDRMRNLLKRLKERYDYVVMLLPPTAAVTDAVVASHLADGMVILVRADQTVRGGLTETMRRLRLADAKILGFVFSGGVDSATKYNKKRGL